MGWSDHVSMVLAPGTRAALDACSWAGTLGWRAGCEQLGMLRGVSETQCQPLEWDWGPIYLCCGAEASVGV